jgi:hypothetical protein
LSNLILKDVKICFKHSCVIAFREWNSFKVSNEPKSCWSSKNGEDKKKKKKGFESYGDTKCQQNTSSGVIGRKSLEIVLIF